MRQRLAENLAAVLSQRLIPRAGGKGMVPAFELMVQTPRISELLLEGETGELARMIEQGTDAGLISFNHVACAAWCSRTLVELKDALAASDRPEELVLALRGITSSNTRRPGGGPGPAPGPRARLRANQNPGGCGSPRAADAAAGARGRNGPLAASLGVGRAIGSARIGSAACTGLASTRAASRAPER